MEKRTILGYFVAAVGALCMVGWVPFRRWYLRWGATSLEVRRSMPGDGLVPRPRQTYTRAITILAAAADVWPWLAQMGQGRGGLYSYDGLENLAGCNIRSVDRIVPELQDPQPADVVRLGPQGYPCFAVASVEPGRALVLVSADPKTGIAVQHTAPPGKGYSIATWQFVLRPLDEQSTRLLVRQRLSYSPDMAWIWRLTEPVGFVMERRMLLGIRQRVNKNS